MLERAGLVCVVDDHRKRLPLVHRLESSRDTADRLDPARDRCVVDAEQPSRRERTERVLGVEASAQLQLDAVERVGADLRAGGEPERERVRQLRREPAAVLVADVEVEPDRSAAIVRAIGLARDGDVVLIAGKGAEQGQQLADRTIPFDDRDAAREALRSLGAGT